MRGFSTASTFEWSAQRNKHLNSSADNHRLPQHFGNVLHPQKYLPKGFRRARNFGFLHPNSKRLIALLQVVLKVIPSANLTWMKPRPPFLCACCGAPMKVVRRRIAPPGAPRPRDAGVAEGVVV